MIESLREKLYFSLLWLVALFFFSPVAWIIMSSFKIRNDILAVPPKLVFTPTLENYFDLFKTNASVFQQMLNSVVISVTAVIIAVIFSFLAAYCFSRFQPKVTNFLMFLLLSIRMLPGPAVILPVFLMYAAFGWKDSHLAFIFNMIFVWNEFLFNFIICGVSTQNIPYALAVGTYSDGGLNWTFIASMTTVYLIPPVIAIYIFQKYLLVGMTFGTVRGEV